MATKDWLEYFSKYAQKEDHWFKTAEEEQKRYSSSPFLSKQIDWMHWLQKVRSEEDASRI